MFGCKGGLWQIKFKCPDPRLHLQMILLDFPLEFRWCFVVEDVGLWFDCSGCSKSQPKCLVCLYHPSFWSVSSVLCRWNFRLLQLTQSGISFLCLMLLGSIPSDCCASCPLNCGFWSVHLWLSGWLVRLILSHLSPLLAVLLVSGISYVLFVFHLISENCIGLCAELTANLNLPSGRNQKLSLRRFSA